MLCLHFRINSKIHHIILQMTLISTHSFYVYAKIIFRKKVFSCKSKKTAETFNLIMLHYRIWRQARHILFPNGMSLVRDLSFKIPFCIDNVAYMDFTVIKSEFSKSHLLPLQDFPILSSYNHWTYVWAYEQNLWIFHSSILVSLINVVSIKFCFRDGSTDLLAETWF